MPCPQPFHAGAVSASGRGAEAALQNADFGIGPPVSAVRDFPDTYSASARRCARLRSAARVRIAPLSSDSSTCSALIRFSTSRPGACGFAPGPS